MVETTSLFERDKMNCISLIRLIAALQVMFGHSIEHLELPIDETVCNILYFFRGVPIFFGLSGFLIWLSIFRSKNYSKYIWKRFLRIYPELWGAVIVEIIVLVIFYHPHDISSLLLFLFGQGTIFQFWTPDSLRNYGVGTPNGALWTIGVMFQFYAVAWPFAKVMRNRKMPTWIIGFFFSVVISALGSYIVNELVNISVVTKLYDQTVIKYFWLFYIGMFFAEFRDSLLPLLKRYWYIFIFLAFFFFWTKLDISVGYYFLWSFFLIIGLLGFSYRFPQLNVKNDISYGLFLYHMIVVNVFVNFNWIGKWIFVVPVTIISVFFAYISTQTLGKLHIKNRAKLSTQ